MKKIAILIITILLAAGVSFADEACPTAAQKKGAPVCARERSLEAIELLTGYSWGHLKGKDNYNFYPVILDFDLNLKALTKKLNFNPRSLLQFQIEPFIGCISSPESNVEVGTSFFLKAGVLPQTSKFQPYIKAGVGFDYMTLHTREQSTQFNFISTGAVGMHLFFNKNTALTVEGRYRHLSNASIEDPNSGINTYYGTAGLTYQF